VAGPLIGGFLTSNFSWRWIFYVNLPLGAIALGVLAVTLPGARERVEHAVDYLGTALLAIALSGIVLATTLGGTQYAWGSPLIVGLGVMAVVALVAFVAVERRAAEPVLPPALFRNRVFSVTSAIGFVVGFALFGALTYLPLFQQIVRGSSPTESGLQLVPVMAGVLIASIASGQIISRTGHYKAWPIAGTAVASVGMISLSTMGAGTSTGEAALEMLVLGLGLGMVMQVLVLAVQNAVPYEQLGVATSGATLFRSIGGSIGTAILGTIFTNRLDDLLASGGASGSVGALDPSALDQLPAAQHDAFIAAFTDALGLVFTVAACVLVCAFLITWLLEERPLRTTVATAGMHEAFATPEHPESVRTVALELSRLVGREGARDFVRRTTAGSGLDISPLESWVLVRTATDRTLDVPVVAESSQLEVEHVRGACRELHRRGLLTDAGDAGTGLTEDGAAAVDALADARRGALVEMAADWEPAEHPELAEFIERLSEDLTVEAPRTSTAAG
jgi:MFS family permease